MTPYQRRFGGIGRLYGSEGLERLRRAHICVVGLGGVGSWVAEALARTGVGALTLVDLDDVCISNANRQLHAVQAELGKPKAEAMARRVLAINPDCAVRPLQSFFVNSTADEILSAGYAGVVDAIDSTRDKCLLIALCRQKHIPLVTTGGAGGRRDPTALTVADLAFSSHDRLLTEVRRILREDHGFPHGHHAFGVDCVFSREAPVFPQPDGTVCETRAKDADLRLDCNSGYGTASFVTGAFGFAAAARIVQRLASPGA